MNLEQSPRRRSRYVGAFLVLVALTALELTTIRLDVERAARITALVGLAMGKAAILLWLFMDLRTQSRMVRVLALSPLVLAPGFTIVLMLDAVYRIAGAR
jgi:caa(3)-type oxidase subunit IV